MVESYGRRDKNDTWELMELPNGKKGVVCKWVYKIKYNDDGSIEKHKARLMEKWYTQQYDIEHGKR